VEKGEGKNGSRTSLLHEVTLPKIKEWPILFV
jgi:hypothetical protein